MSIFCIQEISEPLIDAMKSPIKIWQVRIYQYFPDDVMRFMYENHISMATLAGHGVGAKVALAAGCYHNEKVTGVVGFDSSPMNQFYH